MTLSLMLISKGCTMNILILLVLISLIFLFSYGSNKNTFDKSIKYIGIKQKIHPCLGKPNCINTEYPEKIAHFLPPLDYPHEHEEQVMLIIKNIILETGGQIFVLEDSYLGATYTSKLFKFIDDFEIRLDNRTDKVHIRSASRLGYSDFGVNKRRVEKFSKLFNDRIRG